MASERRRGKRQRVCSWCSQSFTKDDHLMRHIRTHTREKPFVCGVCKKGFSRHDSLLRHSRNHTQPTAFNEASHALSSQVGRHVHTGSAGESHTAQTATTGAQPINYYPIPSLRGPLDLGQTCARSQFEQSRGGATASIGDLSLAGNSLYSPPIEPGEQHELCTGTGAGPGTPDIRTPHSNDTWNAGQVNQPYGWGSGAPPQIPGWFVNDDFDLDGFNLCILDSASNWLPRSYDDPVLNTSYDVDQVVSEPPSAPPKEDLVKQHWFTFIAPSTTGSVTPDVEPEEAQINDEYRDSLTHKLHQTVPSSPLPSTDVMNLCIQMYFTKFNPVFPIVHAPTFRPSAKSSLLLLSICSVGSLFIGSPGATTHGERIFEMLNKAILASWERYIARGGTEAIAMVQAAIIGQTFGLLSGRPKDLLVAESFHGTVIAWARRYGVFGVPSESFDSIRDEARSHPKTAWVSWIREEEQKRLAFALCIHDAEISGLLLTAPFLRVSAASLPNIAGDSLWEASTVEEWCTVIEGQISTSAVSNAPRTPHSSGGASRHPEPGSIRQSSGFSQYLELELISSNITEDWKERGPCIPDYNKMLVRFHDLYLKGNDGRAADTFFLHILWHSAYLSLFVDVNRLELAVGKSGYEQAQLHRSYASEWASSIAGHRCALHGALILRHLESTGVGTEPPIHVPRVVFRAALVWFCYCEFGQGRSSLLPATADFSELLPLGIDCQRVLFEANNFKSLRSGVAECRTLYALIDMLDRIGHWGVSDKLGSLLRVMVSEKTDSKAGTSTA